MNAEYPVVLSLIGLALILLFFFLYFRSYYIRNQNVKKFNYKQNEKLQLFTFIIETIVQHRASKKTGSDFIESGEARGIVNLLHTELGYYAPDSAPVESVVNISTPNSAPDQSAETISALADSAPDHSAVNIFVPDPNSAESVDNMSTSDSLPYSSNSCVGGSDSIGGRSVNESDVSLNHVHVDATGNAYDSVTYESDTRSTVYSADSFSFETGEGSTNVSDASCGSLAESINSGRIESYPPQHRTPVQCNGCTPFYPSDPFGIPEGDAVSSSSSNGTM
uniref:uncharacterized protein LOC100176835 isoform X2 n=1 Tax=Ciona intestinalis TaxID=7719 RepID=UPI00089DBA4D|nr:uncharacterized protein LOC100176835 isoform X2 [Ciona intestinalis]|eukprot:XP_018673228.1 uncharacterized protein LOC100176835 isoform X2 [Ciona intestinalis]